MLHYNSNAQLEILYIDRAFHAMIRIESCFELYGCIPSLVVTNDTIRTMQPTEGLKLIECEADVVFTTGGLSYPKSGIVPDAGLLEFNTEGGVPYLQKGSVIKDHY